MRRLSLVLITGCIAFASAASAAPGDTLVFLKRWGGLGSGPGQFSSPRGLSVGPTGEILVADMGNHRIQAFTPDGNLAWIWTGPATGGGVFDSPTDIVIDPAGNRYVGDFVTKRINRYDATGNFVLAWPMISPTGVELGPESLALDAQGNLYAAADCWVFRYSASGDFQARWGQCGMSGEAVFRHGAIGVAVGPSGNVYVVDHESDRVQKFSYYTGQFILGWGQCCSEPGNLLHPWGVATNRDESVFVTSNSYVQKFTSSGTFLARWGGYGYGEGQFINPTDICVGSDGRVYVVDIYQHMVQSFGLPTTPARRTSWGQIKALYR
jgi:tripartite motif-containing protein 71